MQIIYITTAIKSLDFSEFQKYWLSPINPSNQNFHYKIIEALANQGNDVCVISIRPFSKKQCTLKYLPSTKKADANLTWNYLKISSNRFVRYFSIKKQANRICKKENFSNAIILTDTINPKCVKIATKLSKKYGYKNIGLVTDSPSNISGTSKSYSLFLLNQCKNLNGYIALTEELNTLYNKGKMPYKIVEGIINNSKTQKIDTNQYFFFGGAMLERYGIYNLIKAYKQITTDVQLLICGHHYNEDKLFQEINGDNRIKFLGILPVEEVIKYEANSIACINPRPYTEDLDRYSIPSKTIEYLASGAVTISLRNSKLIKKFENEAIWVKSNDVDSLKFAMEKVLAMSEVERKNLAQQAQDKVFSIYSSEKVGKSITEFLSQFIK